MSGYAFEITHEFKGHGKVDEAEDWIRANVKGLWGLEFLGMEETGGGKTPILHVRFKFGRADDFNRFRDEFVLRKAPTARPPARRTPPKKKSFWSRLLGD
ncbi:hypothetical protein [Arenibaculum pallidiluteum]|uniref:hypothetical protein n=1 Tax=Arenibaculum pallidiluteum TaxID=2812559 RepID=UPI001A96C63F|nr:hypothetical protein [Arenibaculum pallidiluteum]